MSDSGRLNLLDSRGGRRLLFAALYFSEGAPIGFIWWALPTMLREQGVAADSIGFLFGALALPWALKFLWAPLIDTLRSRRWGFRAWIVTAQLLMGLTLLPLTGGAVLHDTRWLCGILILHAFCAATQDVAVDALCIASVAERERGSLNGWMQAGMLLGRALFGGGALILAGRWGFTNVIWWMIAAVWSSALLVILLTRESEPGAMEAVRERARDFAGALRRALIRPSTIWGLLFAATAGAGFEAIGNQYGPFLTSAGVSREAIGAFQLQYSIGLMLAGSLLGGWLSDRLGKRRVVLVANAGLVIAGLFVAMTATTTTGERYAEFCTALGALYFVIGLFTASSYALFMDLTDPRLGGTQFSAMMGATNLCESWAAFAGGALAVKWGHPAMFAAMSGASLVGLPILLAMRGSTSDAIKGE
ncbi:MAG TPA: MFS transporter [Phycisphaerae bacterium]|nr:MFS transporter [Phycisphaerae bacterium]HRW52436.1 MFS transporter [Phycisphaerae bacterium]